MFSSLLALLLLSILERLHVHVASAGIDCICPLCLSPHLLQSAQEYFATCIPD